MMKLAISLEEGKIKMDLYKEFEGFKFYEFTTEDWKEATDLLNEVNKHLKQEEGGDVNNG